MQSLRQWVIKYALLYALLPAVSAQAYAQYREIGLAAYYADDLHGRPTASGELYDRGNFTCAHRAHPFGTLLKITRLDNGASVTVRVNDKATFQDGFVVSLSLAAAMSIGLDQAGKARVQVEPVGPDGLPAPVTATGPAAYEYELTARSPARPYVPSGLTEKRAEPNPAMPTSRELLPKTAPAAAMPVQPYEYAAMPGRSPDYAMPAATSQTPVPSAYERGLGTLTPAYAPVNGTVTRIARGVGGYGVQLGAFANIGNAELQAATIAGLGIALVFVQEGTDTNNAPVFRLIAGNFQTRIEAERYLLQIREQYRLPGFVVGM
jgi:rare lipoprotein A